MMKKHSHDVNGCKNEEIKEGKENKVHGLHQNEEDDGNDNDKNKSKNNGGDDDDDDCIMDDATYGRALISELAGLTQDLDDEKNERDKQRRTVQILSEEQERLKKQLQQREKRHQQILQLQQLQELVETRRNEKVLLLHQLAKQKQEYCLLLLKAQTIRFDDNDDSPKNALLQQQILRFQGQQHILLSGMENYDSETEATIAATTAPSTTDARDDNGRRQKGRRRRQSSSTTTTSTTPDQQQQKQQQQQQKRGHAASSRRNGSRIRGELRFTQKQQQPQQQPRTSTT